MFYLSQYNPKRREIQMKRSEKSIVFGIFVVMFCFLVAAFPVLSQAATTIVNPVGPNVINAAIAASAPGEPSLLCLVFTLRDLRLISLMI